MQAKNTHSVPFQCVSNFLIIQDMGNRISELRLEKDWSQARLAEEVNIVLERHPELKKPSRKNPDGLIDQQTIQRLEKGITELSDRWMEILGMAFGVKPWQVTDDLSGIPLLKKLSYLEEEQQKAFENMLDTFIKEKK